MARGCTYSATHLLGEQTPLLPKSLAILSRSLDHTVSDSATKRPIPARAIASALFACSSLFVFRLYGQVHWLPKRFSKDSDDVFHRVLSQVGPIRDQLDVAYRVLAVIALIWCIWSWRTERRVAALIATGFAGLAMFCAVFIVI